MLLQFINDKHNTDVNENTYIFELKNVMENEYKNSAHMDYFNIIEIQMLLQR